MLDLATPRRGRKQRAWCKWIVLRVFFNGARRGWIQTRSEICIQKGMDLSDWILGCGAYCVGRGSRGDTRYTPQHIFQYFNMVLTGLGLQASSSSSYPSLHHRLKAFRQFCVSDYRPRIPDENCRWYAYCWSPWDRK